MSDLPSLAAAVESAAAAIDTASPDAWDALDREGLAAVLVTLDIAVATLNGAASEAQRLLAQLMEGDEEVVGAWRLTRSRPERTEWAADTARADVTTALVHRHAFDPETGELRPGLRHMLIEALAAAFAAVSSAPKANLNATGLRALGLNPTDYRTIIEGGYRVKVAPR